MKAGWRIMGWIIMVCFSYRDGTGRGGRLEDKSCLNTNPRHRSVKQNIFKTWAVPPRVHMVDRSIHSDDSEGIPSGAKTSHWIKCVSCGQTVSLIDAEAAAMTPSSFHLWSECLQWVEPEDSPVPGGAAVVCLVHMFFFSHTFCAHAHFHGLAYEWTRLRLTWFFERMNRFTSKLLSWATF